MADNGVLMIEFDGATWDIIDPLIDDGKLPNIKRLRDTGASGTLMSEHAAISPKIWTSMFAGKDHTQTGIDFFGGYSKMVKCKRLWDILSEKGYTVGVFGSFATWPPYEVNGFMIPAIDSVGTETYPPEFEVFQEVALSERKKSKGIEGKSSSLSDMVQYGVRLRRMGVRWNTYLKVLRYFSEHAIGRFGQQEDQYWKKLALHSELSTDVFIHLCSTFKPDFRTIHMHICDSLSHRYWMAYEDDKFPGVDNRLVQRYKDVIPKGYMQADRAIGRILDAAGEKTNVVLVSDHGFEARPGGFNPYDLNVEKLQEVLGIKGKVIVARFGPGMYLNFQDDELMDRAARILKEAFSQKTGEKVFDVETFEKTIIVQKPTWEVKRDEILQPDSFIDFGACGLHKALDLYTRQNKLMSGVHAPEGMFVLHGPDIQSDIRLDPISFYDIAPTVLVLMGLPVARDMKGRVIKEAMEDRFLEEQPIREIETYEEEKNSVGEAPEEMDYEKIEERLKSLGYL